MNRTEKTGVVIGGVAGLLLWLFDSKHVILGGSPHTPISDFIHRILPIDALCDIKLEGISVVCNLFSTLLVFAFVGIVVGYTAASIKLAITKPPPSRP